MRDIIENILNKYSVGSMAGKNLKFQLMRASIKKEQRVLSLDMTLNFVMPLAACHDIKYAVAEKLDNKINGVEINFSYDGLNMKEEEIIAAFIPHMIETAGCGYAGIAKAIQADNFEWDGKPSPIALLSL